LIGGALIVRRSSHCPESGACWSSAILTRDLIILQGVVLSGRRRLRADEFSSSTMLYAVPIQDPHGHA